MKTHRDFSWLAVLLTPAVLFFSVNSACFSADEAAEARLRDILKTSKKTTDRTELIRICGELLVLADSSVTASEFPTANRAASMALDLATRAGNKHWMFRLKSRRDDIQNLMKEHKSAAKFLKKLETDPDDADANQKAGLFVAAMLGDWKRGAEMLGKSGNPLLVKISEGELAQPEATKERTTLGAAWRDAAKEESPALKLRMLKRGYHWYQLAYRAIEGLDKQDVESGIDDFPFRFLTDIEPTSPDEGLGRYGQVGGERTPEVSVDGIRYPLGLGMATYAESMPHIVKFNVAGKYKSLQTGCALNDSGDEFRSIMHFTVIGDGRVIWRSSPVKTGADIEFVTLNIKSVKTLEIRTESNERPSDGHAVWLDPILIK